MEVSREIQEENVILSNNVIDVIVKTNVAGEEVTSVLPLTLEQLENHVALLLGEGLTEQAQPYIDALNKLKK